MATLTGLDRVVAQISAVDERFEAHERADVDRFRELTDRIDELRKVHWWVKGALAVSLLVISAAPFVFKSLVRDQLIEAGFYQARKHAP